MNQQEWMNDIRKECGYISCEEDPDLYAEAFRATDSGIVIGISILNKEMGFVDLSREFSRGNKIVAINKVLKTMKEVRESDEYKNCLNIIRGDIRRYYMQGGKNWSGD